MPEAQLPTGGQATPSVRPYRPFAALALARRTDLLLFLFFLCRFVAGSPLSSPPLASKVCWQLFLVHQKNLSQEPTVVHAAQCYYS